MLLYVEPCHVESAEIAVAVAVPIENPADCEVRGVIRLLQTQALLRGQFHYDIFGSPPCSPDLAPSDFFLFLKMKEHIAGKRFAKDENLKNASTATWCEEVVHKLYSAKVQVP